MLTLAGELGVVNAEGQGGEEETLNVVSDVSQPVPPTIESPPTIEFRRRRWLVLGAFVVIVASGPLFVLFKPRRPRVPFGGFMADDLVFNVETKDFGRFVRHEATADGKQIAIVALVNNRGLARFPLEDIDFVDRD